MAMNLKRSYQRWLPTERQTLINLVLEQKNQGSQISWIKIAQVLQGKTPRQCYDQWLQVSKDRSDVQKYTWSSNELQQLERAVDIHGKDFETIHTQYFPHIQPKTIKHKFNQLQRSKNLQSVESASTSSSTTNSFISDVSVHNMPTSQNIPLEPPDAALFQDFFGANTFDQSKSMCNEFDIPDIYQSF